MDHVVVVCGYGCHLVPELQRYLDRVVVFANTHRPKAIILCGGYTQQKSAPGISEAGLMRSYIAPGLHKEYNPMFRLEVDSCTTGGNIKNASSWLRDWYTLDPPECIIIFCEAQRSPNVIMLARHFMGNIVKTIDDITVETASWERADPFKQAKNLIYNRLAIKYPWLGLAEREQRKRLKQAAVN